MYKATAPLTTAQRERFERDDQYVKRDLYVSKETYICERGLYRERPIERDLYKETYKIHPWPPPRLTTTRRGRFEGDHEYVDKYVQRDIYIWGKRLVKETY